MGAFSGLKDAKRGFSSNPLQAGKYLVRIDQCDFFDTEQNGEMWKNTLTVLSVDDGPHKAGDIVHTFFRSKAGKKTFQSNLKAFLAGVLAVEDEVIDEAAATTALAEDSPMKGLVCVVTAKQRTSKDKMKEGTNEPVTYVVYDWGASLDSTEIQSALGEEEYKRFFPSG